MKQEVLWAAYVAKNPSFAGDGAVTMSAVGLRKLFEQTYQHGHDHGFTNGKAYAEMRKAPTPTTQGSDILNRAFGL